MAKEFILEGYQILVDDEDAYLLENFNWWIEKRFKTQYVYKKSGPLHRHILTNAFRVDHINQNGLDNRRFNLRECTMSQNGMNRSAPANNTSGYKGVSFRKNRNKYRAYITLNGQQYCLGHFNSAKEAAKAYNQAAPKYHGKFAWLNKIEES